MTVKQGYVYAIQITNQIQSINRKKQMHFDNFLMHDSSQELLSLRGESVRLREDVELLPVDSPSNLNICVPDSFSQIERIMDFMDSLELPESQRVSTEEAQSKSCGKKVGDKKAPFENSVVPKSDKKIKKVENSPFHNYQKHLNNALKKLVIVPSFQEGDELYKHAAKAIWTAYVGGDVKTKKILHFVFNEKNEHQIKEQELKTYGLLGVYQQYGEEVISQAKNYLSKLAIDQIDESNIQGYMKTRKMKKTDGFTEYVMSFRKELLGGYIKRRVQIEQSDQ